MSAKNVLDALTEHPAVTAWNRLDLKNGQPRRIEILTEGRGKKRLTRPAAYRLIKTGSSLETIIAKKCGHSTASKEHFVYQELLSHLHFPVLACYGIVKEEDSRFSWLFLEDAAGIRCSPKKRHHPQITGKWLASTHIAATTLHKARNLQGQGPAYYRECLGSAARMIEDNMGNKVLQKRDAARLTSLVNALELLSANWTAVEENSKSLPETLVHGDFVSKNIHIASRDGDSVCLPFDWATAGWGNPAIDLGALIFDWQPEGWTFNRTEFASSLSPGSVAFLNSYRSTVLQSWPEIDPKIFEQLAWTGVAYRCVISIYWEAHNLSSTWLDHSISRLCLYLSRLNCFLAA